MGERWEEIVADCVARRGLLGTGDQFTKRGTFIGEEDRLEFLARRIAELEAERAKSEDLLAALRKAVCCIRDTDDTDALPPWWGEVLRDADAAIAKAEGGSDDQ